MTDHIGLLIGAAWGFSSVIAGFLIARAIPPSGDEILEMHPPRGDGQHLPDQRLERRGFGQAVGSAADNHFHNGAMHHD